MKREIKVCGIIYKKDKQGISILLENDNNEWNVLFGSIENEDEIEEKTKLIAQEKSGLSDIRTISDLTRQKYWFQNGQDLVHRRVYSFLFELPQTSTEIPSENLKSLKWFKPEEALQVIPGQDAKLIVLKALEKLKVTV